MTNTQKVPCHIHDTQPDCDHLASARSLTDDGLGKWECLVCEAVFEFADWYNPEWGWFAEE